MVESLALGCTARKWQNCVLNPGNLSLLEAGRADGAVSCPRWTFRCQDSSFVKRKQDGTGGAGSPGMHSGSYRGSETVLLSLAEFQVVEQFPLNQMV